MTCVPAAPAIKERGRYCLARRQQYREISFFVPLKRIYPRYIVQYAVVPYNVGIRYFGVIIHGEQDFFLVVVGAEKVSRVKPHT